MHFSEFGNKNVGNLGNNVPDLLEIHPKVLQSVVFNVQVYMWTFTYCIYSPVQDSESPSLSLSPPWWYCRLCQSTW